MGLGLRGRVGRSGGRRGDIKKYSGDSLTLSCKVGSCHNDRSQNEIVDNPKLFSEQKPVTFLIK